MATQQDYSRVARKLKDELGNNAFISKRRVDITHVLREVTHGKTTKLGSRMAEDLETELLHQGLHVYPPLAVTESNNMVRLFHQIGPEGQQTATASLVHLIAHPSPETDAELGRAIKKYKGTWEWNR